MKVGEYVRTKYGEIAKIDKCLGKDNYYKNMQHYETDRMVNKFNNFILYEEDIIKSSPNIIDLIEAGDILEIKDMLGNISKVEVDENFKLLTGKIVAITTHEQYEANKYKIGE